VSTSPGGILVPKGIIRPVVSVSRRVSGITFIGHAKINKNGIPNNLKPLERKKTTGSEIY
jgi:hypothetical protein